MEHQFNFMSSPVQCRYTCLPKLFVLWILLLSQCSGFFIISNCYLSKSVRVQTFKPSRALTVYYVAFVGRGGPNGWAWEDPSHHGVLTNLHTTVLDYPWNSAVRKLQDCKHCFPLKTDVRGRLVVRQGALLASVYLTGWKRVTVVKSTPAGLLLQSCNVNSLGSSLGSAIKWEANIC